MSTELNIEFTGSDKVQVRFDGADSGTLPFVSPVTEKDRKDLQWYLEVYGAHSLGDPDDAEARRIKSRLPQLGKALFDAVFADRAAQRVFNEFQDCRQEARLLTIHAEHPSVLSLPWELLHDPATGGVFLFHENPRISVRRRLGGATGGRPPLEVASKDGLHILFVVSRPEDSGFLDPRADAGAVMDALNAHGAGRFTWEFLRPPTVDALTQRLEDRDRPPVDILHFDGHGVFDRHGGLPERAAKDKQGVRFPFDDEVRDKAAGPPDASPPGTGYLLFEKPDGKLDFVSADRLGQNLHRQKVALVILSACQTAALGDEPMGSVAARLTGTGIPAVLAMTHSVLVATTRTLFGRFYGHLAKGQGIGEALDNARRHLANYPQKYEVQRGPQRVMLELDDWFLPALYQGGDDVPLLAASNGPGGSAPAVAGGTQDIPAAIFSGRLRPRDEAGFFGRRRELWGIERWFADQTRRISITGFGGQGKTELALEAGRWLVRAGMFRRAVFVDYSQVQAEDALSVAVSSIGSVLDSTLSDADEAAGVLAETPTLLILDNLEAVGPGPLRELLDAAVGWSLAGPSRVLATSRLPDFDHPQYRVAGTLEHRRIVLEALGSRQFPDDALEWFAALGKLPPPPEVPTPDRQALIELFDRVKFHPLSIRVLAQQLKTRRPAELGERLEELLAGGATAAAIGEDTPAELLASLELSLDRLDEDARRVLPRLGVFQGGALESELLAITELGEGEENLWPGLRGQLEAAALIVPEGIPGVESPFLRFHPTLAPMLWAALPADEQARLSEAHRGRYYALSGFLYHEDHKSPHEPRAIAWRELPNLLHAVHRALEAGDPDAVIFVETVSRFLNVFGLTREAESLGRRAEEAGGKPGSQAWFLAQSNKGERLFASGRVGEAAKVFSAIVDTLGDGPTYERAVTLCSLGRCHQAGGRPDLAEVCHRDGIGVTEQLKQSDEVKRHRGNLYGMLGNALAELGKLGDGRKAYEEALSIHREVRDLRGQSVTLGQLGSLAETEGKLEEALGRNREALALFQRLREPASEAVAWHQLGRVFQEARQWDEAERHYRESARLKEKHGNLAGAARTWNQLAILSNNAGRPDAAETWYRKALEVFRSAKDQLSVSGGLNNLAGLLRTQPGRLAEARGLAEEALAIRKTLDPGAVEIWKAYNILAKIADQEAAAAGGDRPKAELQQQAAQHRRAARDAKRNFAGTRHELKRHVPLIVATLAACQGNPQARQAVARYQEAMRKGQPEWGKVADTLDRILSGERDAEALCEGLELNPSMLIETILEALADPSTLEDLLPPESAAGQEG